MTATSGEQDEIYTRSCSPRPTIHPGLRRKQAQRIRRQDFSRTRMGAYSGPGPPSTSFQKAREDTFPTKQTLANVHILPKQRSSALEPENGSHYIFWKCHRNTTCARTPTHLLPDLSRAYALDEEEFYPSTRFRYNLSRRKNLRYKLSSRVR